jgi:hypothetical protein
MLSCSIQGHREGESNSPNATVYFSLQDDDRTSHQIQLDDDMCSTSSTSNNVGRSCSINVTHYVGAAECSIYNLSVVEGDVTHNCNQNHGDQVTLLFLNKFGCQGNPFEELEKENSTATVVVGRSDTVNATLRNSSKLHVNETSMMSALVSSVSISGHSCRIQKIENVRIDGEEFVFSWEDSSSSLWTQKSTLWLYLAMSLVVFQTTLVAYMI